MKTVFVILLIFIATQAKAQQWVEDSWSDYPAETSYIDTTSFYLDSTNTPHFRVAYSYGSICPKDLKEKDIHFVQWQILTCSGSHLEHVTTWYERKHFKNVSIRIPYFFSMR